MYSIKTVAIFHGIITNEIINNSKSKKKRGMVGSLKPYRFIQAVQTKIC